MILEAVLKKTEITKDVRVFEFWVFQPKFDWSVWKRVFSFSETEIKWASRDFPRPRSRSVTDLPLGPTGSSQPPWASQLTLDKSKLGSKNILVLQK